MSKRIEQKNNTREKILKSAMELFSNNGIIGTKTSDIAKNAGISHGLIFNHFPTKENLIDTIIQNFGMNIAENLHDLCENKTSLKDILYAHLEGLKTNENFYTKLISEAPILHRSAVDSLIMIQSAISHHFLLIIEKEKNLYIDSPVHLLFNTWLGLLHYYLTNRHLFTKTDSLLENHGKELINHYMKLISIKESII